MTHTFGIEEETMIVDRTSLEPVESGAVFEAVRGDPVSGPYVSREYLACQVEFSSPVFSGLDEASLSLARFRSAVAGACGRMGSLPWNGGVPFRTSGRRPVVTPSARYEGIARGLGAVVDDHRISALHVHVGVPGRSEGVRVLNGVRPWLPALLALGGDSPFWRGSDTGFASWRSILMSRWTTNGCPPQFADAADYDARLARLVGVGGTADIATVAWNLRLSETLPTIEFRVFDAQLEAWQSVLLAALCRALVVGVLEGTFAGVPMHPELLDAALWHAARDGIAGRLVHPATGSLEPAGLVVADLRRRIAPALETLGDAASVDRDLHRLLREGTGATRQRVAFERAGVDGLRELALTAAAG